jgi:putative toxin-antitoxin system antitoxin component (TIGR02293 family)
MAAVWKIRWDEQRTESIEIPPKAYHFFTETPAIVAESQANYGEATLDFHETSLIFDYLDFNSAEIAELLEVDPSTLFRWKKEDRKLSKGISKRLLEIDLVLAKGIRIFGSEELLSEWLQLPNEALGQQKPIDLLKNPYQIAQVDQALESLSWGNVS